MIDDLYKNPKQAGAAFTFDHKVAEVFDNMIERSVPLYDAVQIATAKVAKQLAPASSVVYDLGCATGNTLRLLVDTLNPAVEIIGVDNSRPMLEKCQAKLLENNLLNRVKLIEADISKINFKPASLIILNYTLQFVSPNERLSLLKKIASSLGAKKGALILSEKIRLQGPRLQELLTELHHDFKRQAGYSELEIAKKREALENVLIPLTLEENFQLLNEAGFSEVSLFALTYNFASFVALK